MIDNIRIILVATSHPGNIGSAARAMKTMGFKRMVLVNPKGFPSAHARALASGADNILQNATIVNSVEEAIADCNFVIAATARIRKMQLPMYKPKPASKLILTEARQHKVAIMFGREDSGLMNNELELCHAQLNIPTNANFSSLNLAAAIQIICYELKSQLDTNLSSNTTTEINNDLATVGQINLFYNQLKSLLTKIDFFKTNEKQIMHKFKQIYNKSRLTIKELAMLRGFLTETEKKISD